MKTESAFYVPIFKDLMPAGLRRAWMADGSYPEQALYDLFAAHARTQAEKAAVIVQHAPGNSEEISYTRLHEAVLRLAHGLQALALPQGAVLACQLPNGWQACALELACAALGLVVAPLPPGRGKLDLLSLLRRCRAGALVAVADSDCGGKNLAGVLQEEALSLPDLHLLIDAGGTPPRPGWHSFAAILDHPPRPALPKVDPQTVARLLVSSGTESEPKLVAYSHQALAGGRGRFLHRLHPPGDSMRALFLVPLGSSFGSLASFGILACLGGTLILQPRFDNSEAICAIAAHRASHIFAVPTMLQRMAAAPELAAIDKSSLQVLISGGALIAPASSARCQQAFACALVSLYGSADGINCHTMPDDSLARLQHTVGKPCAAICEIRIVDEQRQPVAQGEIGEIAARGPLSPLQYVHAPELDARYRDHQGWVYTGDLGLLDKEGYLILAGRKKDIIIRGGVNVSPAQIENIISAHPQVAEAACVPVPDPDLGQKVGLCLVLHQGAALNLSQIQDFMQERGLERNKWPQLLHLYRQFPLTPAGKLDKRRLSEHFLSPAAKGECHE